MLDWFLSKTTVIGQKLEHREEGRVSNGSGFDEEKTKQEKSSPFDRNGEMDSAISLVPRVDGNPARFDTRSDRLNNSFLRRRESSDDNVNEGIHGSRVLVEELNDRAMNLANTLLSTELFTVSGKVCLLESVLEPSGDPFLGIVELLKVTSSFETGVEVGAV